MKTWTAPLAVAIIGGITGIIIGEPAASLICIAIAGLGYALNKRGN